MKVDDPLLEEKVSFSMDANKFALDSSDVIIFPSQTSLVFFLLVVERYLFILCQKGRLEVGCGPSFSTKVFICLFRKLILARRNLAVQRLSSTRLAGERFFLYFWIAFLLRDNRSSIDLGKAGREGTHLGFLEALRAFL